MTTGRINQVTIVTTNISNETNEIAEIHNLNLMSWCFLDGNRDDQFKASWTNKVDQRQLRYSQLS